MSFLICTCILLLSVDAPWQIGVAKVDITPGEPVRLTGYSNRSEPFTGVEDKIFARTIALRGPDGKLNVLSSVEVLGVSAVMRESVLKRVADLGLRPERFTLCATHTHTAPHLEGVATGIFSPRLEGAQADRTRAYTDGLVDRVVDSIRQAVAGMVPGRVEIGWGSVGFAKNRRVIKDGKCIAMGPYDDGPVDHRLGILRFSSTDGKPKAILFNYACHATTLTGEFNRVSPDWPGYACADLEKAYPGAIGVPIIGCGADMNPEPRGTLENAKAHGAALAKEAARVLSMPMREVRGPIVSSFGYAGLPPVRPNPVELAAKLASTNGHVKQHAQRMLDIIERKGRIPETYPAPLQVMRFGDDLTMIFIGGEVVVDYDLRLMKELAKQVPADRLLVTAYANDVYGYLASERVRNEGGYEFDYSMIFYDQPGPWESGTEELVLGRIKDLFQHPGGEGNLDPKDALNSIHTAAGLDVELVACEPLIQDPVNIAFGPDGKLWVAEMGDYPLGVDGKGASGGRVRYLEDTDGDGVFDKSTLFLEGLKHTTGVHPWGRGVIVSSCPEVFYAESESGSGPATKRTTILKNFGEGNPQHVVNGFCMSLDNWLLINGDETGNIESVATGKVVSMQGRDGRFKVTGELETECGMTQHLRSRDDWGNWFGGANYCPFWHYVVEERYIRRNPHVPSPKSWLNVHPAFYPQVFPSSRIVDRFNDLFTAGRFTSACSPMPYRDTLLGEASHETFFVCEPVHNLVHRARVQWNGERFVADRFPEDEKSEFFSSTDPWSRPVRVITGPDGAVWIVDMYRLSIEHPEWIPDSWLQRIDVRAGHEKGRIYRVFPKEKRPKGSAIPKLVNLKTSELVMQLGSDNGWRRDMAQQLLIERQDKNTVDAIRPFLTSNASPRGIIHALGTLEGLHQLTPVDLLPLIDHPHEQVRRWAIRFSEPFLETDESLRRAVANRAADESLVVRRQVAGSLGESRRSTSPRALAEIARRDGADEWSRSVILSSSVHQPLAVLKELMTDSQFATRNEALVDGLLATAVGIAAGDGYALVLNEIVPRSESPLEPWQAGSIETLLHAFGRRDVSLAKWCQDHMKTDGELVTRVERAFDLARSMAGDDKQSVELRARALRLVGRGPRGPQEDTPFLEEFLTTNQPIELQRASIHAISKSSANQTPTILLGAWGRLTPAARSDVLGVLVSRPAWALELIEAIRRGSVLLQELDAGRRQELLSTTHEKLRTEAEQLFASSQSTSRAEALASHQSALTLPGDPSRGRALFERNCASCHRFAGLGHSIGPELGTLRDRSAAYLLPAVLDPNRAVEAKYLSYSIQLTDGRVLSGMIVEDGTTSITLARPDGTLEKVLRTDIDEMAVSGKSFMPEGLEKDLSPQNLADIFSFLSSVSP